MPKIVDHAARREELAQAVWRLVTREGIEAASIRRVAAEAGCSAGSLRHYFRSHSDLLAFAMELVIQRVSARVAALTPDPEPRLLLHEVLPLDPERFAEAQVWLAFTTQALVDPGLHALREQAHADLRGLCHAAAELRGSADPKRDGERLHALVDGLALHAVLDPAVTTPERQVELLDEYLQT